MNPYINSKYKRINLSILEPIQDTQEKKEKEEKMIYSRNLSLLQNPVKSFNYYGYNQSKN